MSILRYIPGTCDYANKYVAWYEKNWIYISCSLFALVGVLAGIVLVMK